MPAPQQIDIGSQSADVQHGCVHVPPGCPGPSSAGSAQIPVVHARSPEHDVPASCVPGGTHCWVPGSHTLGDAQHPGVIEVEPMVVEFAAEPF